MRNTNILPFKDYFVLKDDQTNSLQITTFGSGETIVESKLMLLKFMYRVIRPHLHERGAIIHAAYHIRERCFIST